MPCPCGLDRALDYTSCCGRYISGREEVPTAEALMRSRYTAYVRAEVDWVFDTHDPRTRDVTKEAIREWSERAKWQGLSVLSTEAGSAEDREGVVTFEARFLDGGLQFHRERSTFRRHEGKWVYVSGVPATDTQEPRRVTRVGRNDPCPCGSGKKYKKCCA